MSKERIAMFGLQGGKRQKNVYGRYHKQAARIGGSAHLWDEETNFTSQFIEKTEPKVSTDSTVINTSNFRFIGFDNESKIVTMESIKNSAKRDKDFTGNRRISSATLLHLS